MAGHATEVRQPRKARLLLLDVAIVAVLVLAALAVVQQRRSQSADDGPARSIAAWALDAGASRVAWPADERRAVPALLAAGVTPVLLDPGTPPLDYAVNDTAVVVVHDGDQAPDAAVATFEAGSFTAYQVDLARAARAPLAPGESVGIEYSRPYRYAPIMPSLAVDVDTSPSIALQLEPGHYRWSIDAMAPKAKGSLRARVSVDGTTTDTDLAMEAASSRPQVIEITVSGDGSHQVVLTFATFATDAVPRPAVYVHSWTLEREVDR